MKYESSLQHWGIKGMKWGVRRYQNKDGTLTEAGEKRYSSSEQIKTKSKPNLPQHLKRESRLGKKKKEIEARQQKRKKVATALNMVSIGSHIASKVLANIGSQQYQKYASSASPFNVAVVRGTGYASVALNVIGKATGVASLISRYQYERDYWRY